MQILKRFQVRICEFCHFLYFFLDFIKIVKKCLLLNFRQLPITIACRTFDSLQAQLWFWIWLMSSFLMLEASKSSGCHFLIKNEKSRRCWQIARNANFEAFPGPDMQILSFFDQKSKIEEMLANCKKCKF